MTHPQFSLNSSKKYNEGSVEFGAVIILLFVAVSLSGGVLFASSGLTYINADTRDYSEKHAADNMLNNIISEMQSLAQNPYDHKNSEIISGLCRKYSGQELEFSDVSSGYHLDFLSDADLADSGIANFIFKDNNGSGFISWRNVNGLSTSKNNWIEFIKEQALDACVSHGWLHISDRESFAFNKLCSAFNTSSEEQLFPLVNNFPRININMVEPEILRPLIMRSSYRLERAGEKADALISRLNEGPLLYANVSSILNIPSDHPLMTYLGTKTSFWKIRFKFRNNGTVEAIIAAIPKKDGGIQEIEQYRLVERRFLEN